MCQQRWSFSWHKQGRRSSPETNMSYFGPFLNAANLNALQFVVRSLACEAHHKLKDVLG